MEISKQDRDIDRAIELIYYKPNATYEDHLESVNLFFETFKRTVQYLMFI